MPEVVFEIIFLLVLILTNGVLAMAEIAVVSARKFRLQQRAEEGDPKARQALALAEHPADFLSTVQVGITLVGVLAGAFGGATFARYVSVWLDKIPLLAPYSDAIAIFLVVLLITYLSLVLGELAPKRLALTNPEAVAAAIAGPMQTLSRLTLPLVRFLSLSTSLALRVLGVKPSGEPPITEDEIRRLIDQGTQAGIFEVVEQDMVEAIFRLADRRVDTLMVPRTEVVWLDLDDPPDEIARQITSSPFSRFPVAHSSLDQAVGMVQAKDLLVHVLAGEPLSLDDLISQPLYVPESMPALTVLEKFRQSRVQTAMVIDEFGGFQGLVTPFDILEAIVGDIPDIGDTAELGIVQRLDGSWLVDGMLPVDELKAGLSLRELPDEERVLYQTVNGMVMTMLGHIPQVGDRFEWGGLSYEVMDMDGFRVDKVLVSPISAPSDHVVE